MCPLSVINSLCFSLLIIYYQLSIMKKLGLLLVACFAFATISVAQNNIVKSLERNVPGQGKVTIHRGCAHCGIDRFGVCTCRLG